MSRMMEERLEREEADLRWAVRELRRISNTLQRDWPQAAADIEWVRYIIVGRGCTKW